MGRTPRGLVCHHRSRERRRRITPPRPDGRLLPPGQVARPRSTARSALVPRTTTTSRATGTGRTPALARHHTQRREPPRDSRGFGEPAIFGRTALGRRVPPPLPRVRREPLGSLVRRLPRAGSGVTRLGNSDRAACRDGGRVHRGRRIDFGRRDATRRSGSQPRKPGTVAAAHSGPTYSGLWTRGLAGNRWGLAAWAGRTRLRPPHGSNP